MGDVRYHDKEQLDRKLRAMKADGPDTLHVVSDFDRTLTKCFYDGKKIPSSFAWIREGGYLTPDYPKKAFALFNHYHPIETDDTLTQEYKYRKMEEWWREHEKLMIASGMHRDVVEEIIQRYQKVFREGAERFFSLLENEGTPLLIFSAGIGNIIRGFLEKGGYLTPNVHILSNTFAYDEQGYATGYQRKSIHVLNKSETALDDEYRQMVAGRKNVILLGDSLGDLGMVDEAETVNLIRIGFLNEDVEGKIDRYLDAYDVVITGDGPMDEANRILEQITHWTTPAHTF